MFLPVMPAADQIGASSSKQYRLGGLSANRKRQRFLLVVFRAPLISFFTGPKLIWTDGGYDGKLVEWV